MRVIASHLNMRRIDIDSARRRVLEAAERMAEGVAGPETEALVARLDKVTGCPLAELARHAELGLD